jgi:hypothetical protein
MSLSTIEIICAPYEIWLAPVGTAFPDVDEAPTNPWAKLGTSGDKSYDEKGVTVTFDESLGLFTPAGSTAPRKVWRTNEQVTVAADLADLSTDTFATLFNDASVTQAAAGAGSPGKDSFALLKGQDVALFAALVRGVSPEGPDFTAQYQLPIVYQGGPLSPTYAKSGAAMLAASLKTLEDDSDGFGEYVAQTADAS